MGFGKKKFADDKDEIGDAIRKATNKHLTRPDTALNAKVVGLINAGYSDVDGRAVAAFIIGRMRQDNPHKQWLSIVLTQRVLRDCKERLGEARQELLQEVAAIASRPVSTQIVNASAAQKAKQEAFMLLQEHGEDGTAAMRSSAGDAAVQLLVNEQADRSGAYQQPGAVGGGTFQQRYAAQGGLGAGRSWDATKRAVEQEIASAKNQTDVLQEMLTGLKSGTGGSLERSFFEELTAQMVQFRMSFEANVSTLTSFQTPEADALMVRAIECVERMNAALEAYHQVSHKLPA